MNIDDLVNSIPEPGLRAQLAQWVEAWKSDDSDSRALSGLIERWGGHVWFEDGQAQKEFSENLERFKKQAIDGIGGMTLNERLYWFGLFDLWDDADDESRARIRRKLGAKP